MCSSVHASPGPNKETTVSVCREGKEWTGNEKNNVREKSKEKNKNIGQKPRSEDPPNTQPAVLMARGGGEDGKNS